MQSLPMRLKSRPRAAAEEEEMVWGPPTPAPPSDRTSPPWDPSHAAMPHSAVARQRECARLRGFRVLSSLA